MAKFYIQLENQRLPIGEITREEVLAALGIDELFNFTGNFYDLDNNPFSNGANGEFNIVDEEGRIIAIVDEEGIHSIEMTAEDESGTVHKLTDKMDRSDFDEIISTDGNNFIIQDEDGNQGFVLTAEGATAHDFITYKGDSLLDVADRVESIETNVGSINDMISTAGNEFIIQDDKDNPNIGLKLNSEGLFVKDVTLNNGEHVLSQKADKTYVDDVKSDMTTELNTKINSLDATVSASGRTYGVKVSVAQTNGKLSSVTVDDSGITFDKLNGNPISTTSSEFIIQDDKANPNVGLKLNSEGLFVKDVTLNNGEHVLSQKADKTYVDDVKSDMTTELNTKINSLDATVSASGRTHGVKVSVTQTNGKLSSVTVDDSGITFDKLNGNPISTTSSEFIIQDDKANPNVGLKLNSEGLFVKDVTVIDDNKIPHVLSEKADQSDVDGISNRLSSIETLLEADGDEIINNLNDVINYFSGVSEKETGAALLSTVATHTTRISTNATTINNLNTTVTSHKAELDGTITSLTSTVASNKAELNNKITALSDVVASNKEEIDNTIASLTTTVSGSGSDYGVTVSVKQVAGLITSVSVNDSGITFDKLNGNPISTTSSEFIIQDDDNNGNNVGLKLNSDGLFVKEVTVIDDNKIQHVLSEKADQIDVDGSISGINETITALAGTVSAISTRVSAAEKSISSNTTDINTLSGRVGTTETSISSLYTTTASLSTRVSATEKSISSLSGAVSSHSSEISTNATNITALTSTVASHTNTIASLSGRVGANEDAISGLNTTVGTHTTTITTLNSTVASHKKELEGSISDLTSTVTSNKDELNGKITALSKTVASNKASLEGSISNLVASHTSDIATINASIASHTKTITSLSGRISANEDDITKLNSTVGTHTTTITTLTSTVASNIAALAGSISDLTSTVTSHTSDISTLQITVTSNASKINSLSGTVSANTSAIASINNITSASATINSNYGKPEVIVSYTGEISNKELNFAFKNLKGDPGAKGSDGYSTYYTSVLAEPTLLIISLSTVTKPSDRTIQEGDFILAPNGNMFRVTGANSTNVSISYLTSIKGSQGPKGDDGTSVNIKGTLKETSDLASKKQTATNGDGYLIDGYLYVYTGSGQTYGFENVGEIKGPQGETGPQGPEGPAGVGISKISKTGETVTITYTDTTTSSFIVKDGADGRGITSVTYTSTSSDNLTKTYTIAYTSGDPDTFEVKDGAPGATGVGISKISKKGNTVNFVDTYEITYTDSQKTKDTFTVTNGAPGAPGEQGPAGYSVSSVVCVDGVDSEVEKNISDTPDDINYYRIKDTNNEFLSGTIGIKNGKNGNDGNDGEDGVNITSVVQTQTSDDDGGENKITVYLSDETEHTFIIKNGSRGPQGETGPKGADGTSVKIKDTLDSTEDLKGKQSDAVNGDGYIIGENLYVYTGGSGEDIYYGFKNVGKIKGPKGDSITITPEEVDGGFKFIINNVSEGTGDGSGGGVFTGDIFYEDILDAPITMDDSGVLDIADDAGYIIAKIDSDGITTTKVKAKNGFYQTSDETLKVFHDSIEVDFNALKSIPKAYYTWKDEDVMQIGTSAQKVQELYPEIVSLDEKTGKMTLDYAKLSVIALKAIDLLHEENENLKLELKSLHNEMDKIKSHLGL